MKHMSLCDTQNFSNPRRNCFSTDRHVLPIVTQKQTRHLGCIQPLSKRLSMECVTLQLNGRAKINIRMRFNVNLMW